jgi:hypothetical protein
MQSPSRKTSLVLLFSVAALTLTLATTPSRDPHCGVT